ncbi:MAG: HAD family hydrolase [Armatimonadetes bacterium]|nr:HAD family hydrolase [Armatimonadota bacterium]
MASGARKPSSLARPPVAVVFDFDGTVADTRIDFGLMRRRITRLLQRWGCWRDSFAQGLYVLEMIEAGAALAAEQGLDANRLLAEAEQVLQDIEVEAARRAPLLEGAAEAFERLMRAEVAVGLITRNCQPAVEVVLERSPVCPSVILPRERARRVKPAPDHLLQALEALDAPPEKSWLVGDHITDVQCAHAAGAHALALVGASSSKEELRAAGADWLTSSLVEAVDFLLDHGA